MKRLAVAVGLVAGLGLSATAANAQWYLSGSAGYAIEDKQKFTGNLGGGPSGDTATQKYNGGIIGLGAVGYGFSSLPFRVEGEIGYHRNNANGGTVTIDGNTTPLQGVTGNVTTWTGMVNGYWDIFKANFTPYIGAGIGAAWINDTLKQSQVQTQSLKSTQFAYQGIVGARYAFNTNWSVKGEYRYLGTTNPGYGSGINGNYATNNFLLGVTYTFAPPPPPPPPAPTPAPVAQPAPPPPPPPPVATPDVYIVFFPWDKADITAVASQVLDRAVEDFRRTGQTKVLVQGYTDTSGTPQYNMKLSERRAAAVAQYFTQHGIPADKITKQWFGEEKLRVATGPNVRNAENRRAEIYMSK